jgi:cytochrome c2
MRMMGYRQSSLGSPALVIWLFAAGCVLLGGCDDETAEYPGVQVRGDAGRGARLIAQYGCGGCHIVPGISGADGLVGPPLNKMARRVYIAGLLRNSPDNLAAWIENPQAIVPGNAMPAMGISNDQARDIVAYLYTLR